MYHGLFGQRQCLDKRRFVCGKRLGRLHNVHILLFDADFDFRLTSTHSTYKLCSEERDRGLQCLRLWVVQVSFSSLLTSVIASPVIVTSRSTAAVDASSVVTPAALLPAASCIGTSDSFTRGGSGGKGISCCLHSIPTQRFHGQSRGLLTCRWVERRRETVNNRFRSLGNFHPVPFRSRESFATSLHDAFPTTASAPPVLSISRTSSCVR